MAQGRAEASLLSAWPEHGPFGTLDLALLLDSIGDLVIVFGADATIKAANRAARRLCASDEDCVIGRSLFDFLHAGEHVRFERALQILASEDAAVPLRLRMTPGTDRLSVDAIAYRYQSADEALFVLVGRDESASASTRMNHDASAARRMHDGFSELQEIFAEMSDFIIRADRHGNTGYVSPSIKRVLGYDATEMPTLNMIHPDDVKAVLKATESLRAVGEEVVMAHRMMHRDGHWVWIESTARALLMSADGHVAELVIVSRDITERKRAEEELAAAYARAEAASATKSRFLANMSHELRTPLNAIIGFSEIIRRELFGAVGAARYKEYAQLIQDSGGHLLDLINDILDMSKIEAGKFDLRFEALDLDDLIRSSLKLVETRAQQAKLMLALEMGGEKPHIHADRRAIKQVLLNLLTNSIKFTPPGGVVTISLRRLTDGVALQVRDTGIGIAEKDLPRITLPFEQVTHDPLLAQAGSGLGLALVQSLVTLHMGTLKIDSVPGEGTIVTVFLPIDPRSRKAA
jgi:PAS domain S-box-containing protein